MRPLFPRKEADNFDLEDKDNTNSSIESSKVSAHCADIEVWSFDIIRRAARVRLFSILAWILNRDYLL